MIVNYDEVKGVGDESPQGMLRFGVICATATASHTGAELPEPEVSSLDV